LQLLEAHWKLFGPNIINKNQYHTHINCPAFVGDVYSRKVDESDIREIPKCEWCSLKDESEGGE
jgi:hypothetical protein